MKFKKFLYIMYCGVVSLAVIYPYFYILQKIPQGLSQSMSRLNSIWPSIPRLLMTFSILLLSISFALYVTYLFFKLFAKRSNKLFICILLTILFTAITWFPLNHLSNYFILLNYLIFMVPIIIFFEVVILIIWIIEKNKTRKSTSII